MAVRKTATKVETPESLALELSKIRLMIEQEQANKAVELQKVTESLKTLTNLSNLDEIFSKQVGDISAKFEVLTVAEQQKIQGVIDQKLSAQSELDGYISESKERRDQIEADYKEKLSEVRKQHNIQIQDADRDLKNAIETNGEAACTKFLKNRGLVTIKSHELDTLQNFKASTEEEIEQIKKETSNTVSEQLSNDHEPDVNMKDDEFFAGINGYELKLGAAKELEQELRKQIEHLRSNNSDTMAGIANIVKSAKTSVNNSIGGKE